MPLILIILILLVAVFTIVRKVIELCSDPKTYKDFFPNIQNASKEIKESNIPFSQLGGTINDITGINRTAVYGVIEIKTEEDIQNALQFARSHKLRVSVAGARHSMGGQAFATNVLVLDMRKFNQISVDIEKKILTVQSGAIWHDIQIFLNPYSLSVEAMQSIDLPTVGGSIAVNAHGMDHRIGGIVSTIQSMRIMLADGSVQTVSNDLNEELFHGVIGGYGLLGVILDVKLTLMDNLSYREEQKIIKTKDFLSSYEKIVKDKNCHMFYGRLSTAPSSFLKEMIIYTYKVSFLPVSTAKQLTPETYHRLRRFVFNLGRKNQIGREIKWWGEKYIQSHLQTFPASRNQIMHRSYAYLKNNLKNNTDVLQEYFLPRNKLLEFIEQLGVILQKHAVITRNVELRVVHKENILLDYVQGDWLGVVLYLNFNIDELDKVKTVHSELIKATQGLGGSFYLPYQLNATREQIEQSYPHFIEFLKLKRTFDPTDLFTSEFYKKYAKS